MNKPWKTDVTEDERLIAAYSKTPKASEAANKALVGGIRSLEA